MELNNYPPNSRPLFILSLINISHNPKKFEFGILLIIPNPSPYTSLQFLGLSLLFLQTKRYLSNGHLIMSKIYHTFLVTLAKIHRGNKFLKDSQTIPTYKLLSQIYYHGKELDFLCIIKLFHWYLKFHIFFHFHKLPYKFFLIFNPKYELQFLDEHHVQLSL